MGPMSVAAAMTGLPKGGKKSTHRGRKPSGKPGAEHLSALQRAHGVGDFKGAKRAALDYAKAVHQHSASESPAEHEALVAQETAAAPTAPKTAPKTDRARLAKIAAMRRKA